MPIEVSYRLSIAITTTLLVISTFADGLDPIEKNGFKLEWTSLSWEGHVDLRADQMHWEATLSGNLFAPPQLHLVGYVAEMHEVVDQSGKSMLPTAFEKRWEVEQRGRRSPTKVQRTIGRQGVNGNLGGFTVELGGGTTAAATIALARGTVYMLEVIESNKIEISLADNSNRWKQVGKNDKIRFRVENIQNRGNQMMVHMSHTLGEYAAGNGNLTQPPYLYNVTSLDAQGRPIPGQTSRFQARGDGQLIVTIFSQDAPVDKPGMIQLMLASKVAERQLDFELKNLKLGQATGTEEKLEQPEDPQKPPREEIDGG